MGHKWYNAGFKGVRYRKHPTRKHGVKFDKYFAIYYQLNGKRREESVGWASDGFKASDAYALLGELRNNHRTGQGPQTLAEKRKIEDHNRKQAELKEQAESLNLDDYWPTYFEHAKRTKKLSSADKEESHYRLWLSPTLGTVPIREIDLLHWDLLVETLSKAQKSKRTIEYVTGTLRRLMKHANNRGLVENPPPTGKRIGVTGPGGSNSRLRVISPEEAESILAEVQSLDANAWRLTKFAFLTGCRASEAFSLKWRDIDRGRHLLVFPETKNRDARELPLAPVITELLDDISEGELDENVFLNANGLPYQEAPSSFKTAVDKLELNNGRTKRQRIVFHSIRHTVATELAKTLNLKDLMEVLGWRTVQTAMRYIKGNEIAKANALASLHGTMKSKKKSGTVVPMRKKNKAS